MTDYQKIDFTALVERSRGTEEASTAETGTDTEVITHSYLRDVRLRSGKTVALITLDNGRDHNRPNTLGPESLLQYLDVLNSLRVRVERGEIHAVAITGKPFILAAGADLSKVTDIPSREAAQRVAQLGHYALSSLSDLGVPSFAFINGLALGGGLEIALHADYRTVSASAVGIGLPEVFLGLVPGWGGAYLLPNLIGIENALRVVIENPLKQNRMLKAADAFELGIADALFPAVNFLEDSLRWVEDVISGRATVRRPHTPGKIERAFKWDVAVRIAEKTLKERIGIVPEAPYAALELLSAAKSGTPAEAFEREDQVLAELISGDQFHASMYAFNLVQKRAKHPAGVPDPKLARPVTRVGILGAGYMASQIALLFLRRLKVPVVITDLDQTRVDSGVQHITDEIEKLRAAGKISPDDANRYRELLTGTTDKAEFAGCDWVIEAVFEDLNVKQQVLAEVEPFLDAEAVLATNTSSLSVARIAENLTHPERLVGFHFFTPVSLMPLIEVVNAERTNEASLSTAMVIARKLKKNAVITADTPGFVVNRILARLLGVAMHAVDQGTPFSVVDEAISPLGLPMAPSALLDLVGLKVAAHVLDTHHAAFPDRFYSSPGLHRLAEYGRLLDKDKNGHVRGFDPKAVKLTSGGNNPLSAEQILGDLQDGLASEINMMLTENVVSAVADIDLCLILGAGFPFHAGGITPYLDRVGASERVFGDTFQHPPIRGLES